MNDSAIQAGALFAVGFSAGAITLGGLAVLFARVILSSPLLLKAIEALASSFPPEMKELVNLLGRLAVEVTDDIPADAKAPAPVAPPGNFGGVSQVRLTPANPAPQSTIMTVDSSGGGTIRWTDGVEKDAPLEKSGNG